MCGLCGILANADHWTDAPAAPVHSTPSQLRQLRTRVANRVLAFYGLKLRDTAGALVVQSATGQTALIPHLGALWPAADKISRRALDPLDPQLVEALNRSDS
jgi:hypothetical protein